MFPKLGFLTVLCGFTIVLGTNSLPAKESSKTLSQTIKTYSEAENYRALGYVAKAAYKEGITTGELFKLAQEAECIPLQRAIMSSKKIMALGKNLGLRKGESLQLALFIEGELPQEVAQNKNYFSRRRTRLPRSVEYDPETKRTFIHLKGHNGVETLGEGYKKKVTKSILYDYQNPEIVAHCFTLKPVLEEIAALQILQGLPGILEYKAITTRPIQGKDAYSIMCKYYKHGQLANFGPKKKYRPNFKEKLSIAVDILRGLEQMHMRGYVHRDVNMRNILVDDADKESRKKGKRYSAVLVDLGRTLKIDETKGHPAQGNVYYLAPEGFEYQKMAPKEYFQTDIYAAGCVLQRLSTGKRPPWVNQKLVRDSSKSRKKLCAVAKKLVAKYRKKRTAALDKKYGMRVDIPPVEGFERVILQMIDQNPRKRPTATQARRLLERYLYVTELDEETAKSLSKSAKRATKKAIKKSQVRVKKKKK